MTNRERSSQSWFARALERHPGLQPSGAESDESYDHVPEIGEIRPAYWSDLGRRLHRPVLVDSVDEWRRSARVLLTSAQTDFAPDSDRVLSGDETGLGYPIVVESSRVANVLFTQLGQPLCEPISPQFMTDVRARLAEMPDPKPRGEADESPTVRSRDSFEIWIAQELRVAEQLSRQFVDTYPDRAGGEAEPEDFKQSADIEDWQDLGLASLADNVRCAARENAVTSFGCIPAALAARSEAASVNVPVTFSADVAARLGGAVQVQLLVSAGTGLTAVVRVPKELETGDPGTLFIARQPKTQSAEGVYEMVEKLGFALRRCAPKDGPMPDGTVGVAYMADELLWPPDFEPRPIRLADFLTRPVGLIVLLQGTVVRTADAAEWTAAEADDMAPARREQLRALVLKESHQTDEAAAGFAAARDLFLADNQQVEAARCEEQRADVLRGPTVEKRSAACEALAAARDLYLAGHEQQRAAICEKSRAEKLLFTGKAAPAFESARDLFLACGERFEAACCERSRAESLLHSGRGLRVRMLSASDAFASARDMFLECGDLRNAALCAFRHATLVRRVGAPGDVLAAFVSARDLFLKSGDQLRAAKCEETRAQVLKRGVKTGSLDLVPETLTAFARARDMFLAGADQHSAAECEKGRAKVLLGRYRAGESEMVEETLQAFAAARDLFRASGDRKQAEKCNESRDRLLDKVSQRDKRRNT